MTLKTPTISVEDATAHNTAHNSNEFSDVVDKLTGACEELGLIAPKFSSSPSVMGAVRTIKRSATGVQIAVVVDDRLVSAVVADMIDGICLVNNLYVDGQSGSASIPEKIQEIHHHLWRAATTP